MRCVLSLLQLLKVIHMYTWNFELFKYSGIEKLRNLLHLTIGVMSFDQSAIGFVQICYSYL